MPRSSTECDLADGGVDATWMAGLGTDRMAHRLRHPLVKPKSITKFARDIRRLAMERRA